MVGSAGVHCELTKVQIRFRLENELTETLYDRIGDANSIYGVDWIKVDPSIPGLVVEYDATRLKPAELQAELRKAGLAVERL